MHNGQRRYFFDVRIGEENRPDDYGSELPSAEDAERDAVVIVAHMMSEAPEVDRAVTVTVRSDRGTLLRVSGRLTVEQVERDA